MSDARTGWPSWAKWVVSAAVLAHGAAVLAAVLAAPPASILQRDLAYRFQRYQHLVAMETSPRYYAPDPPPTPVATIRLRHADGSPETVLDLTRRNLMPRLRYQRHLALANYLYVDAQEAQRDPDGPHPSTWGRAYARHYCRTVPGLSSVAVEARLHLIPDLDRLRRLAEDPDLPRMDLDAEEFFGPTITAGDYPCDAF